MEVVGDAEFDGGAALELSAGADVVVLGADAPLDELSGTDVLVGAVVSGTVELCAKADVIGEKTNDAISVPINAFFAHWFRFLLWDNMKAKLAAHYREGQMVQGGSALHENCLNRSIISRRARR